MAATNHERVGRSLDLLRDGLAPFVEREFASVYGNRAMAEASTLLGEDAINAKRPLAEWDSARGRLALIASSPSKVLASAIARLPYTLANSRSTKGARPSRNRSRERPTRS